MVGKKAIGTWRSLKLSNKRFSNAIVSFCDSTAFAAMESYDVRVCDIKIL